MREKANCLNSNARFMRRALCFKGNTELPFGAGQRQHARSESRRSTYVQRAGLAARQLYSAAHGPQLLNPSARYQRGQGRGRVVCAKERNIAVSRV